MAGNKLTRRGSTDVGTFTPPPGSVPMPDNARYKGSYGVKSESSSAIYKVSFDTAQGCWVCSCPGCIRHGQCKHLDAAGLHGRSYKGQPVPRFIGKGREEF